jgi:L-alanine-DL-glutamate epimerase-like enolase superfamily enzyme
MMIEISVEAVKARAFEIPTDRPEADGTMSWNSTTLVLVEVAAGAKSGLGYTYSDHSIVALITSKLASIVCGMNALAPETAWMAMQRAVRNLGREGLAANAISAVDTALYDLKARIWGVPLAQLLGSYRRNVPIYGSGGFTTYSDTELAEQLGKWVADAGCTNVKMKVGSEPDLDPHRVQVASRAIGERANLFVDANGAYSVKQALELADLFEPHRVKWFEEPVSSDDLAGLHAVRARAPAGMEVAAGEYAYTTDYVRTMLEASAVDVQQADITRCGGVTGFLQIASLCEAHHIDLSGHCAPALHLHAACAVPRLRNLEWFHDHVRIEQMLFDGAPKPRNGAIQPDLSVAGNGLIFKETDAERYAI